jgi:DNA-directed RNA polymerases I, II, and III subunit RPABC2
MNAKVVTDFFGITTPDKEENNDPNVNDGEEKVGENPSDDGEEKVGEKPFDGEEKVGEKSDDETGENTEIEEEMDNDDDYISENDSEDEDDDDDLQKLEGYTEKNILVDYHPEVVQISEEELQTLSNVVKDKNGNIIDPFHTTIPILTKYEKAKIIGIRAQQINNGAEPFITADSNMIDGLTIAYEELMKQKIPFIIRRPMPNGSSEYWNINDLEILE